METPAGAYVTGHNEVKVPENDTRIMQRLFATDNFYGIWKLRFKYVMMQSRKRNVDELAYHKLWFVKAFGLLSMKYKAMTRPNSNICMEQNEENFDPFQYGMS